ncbi:hypothetical protein [Curtobacterium sp. MCSS17_016]|uniref:hypothetical protein n=1 Tax=Curtobacterium sp. MCSS17_016 TaxID=2175644 RepID=UPI000DA6EBBF|nr:hypothetical protein [Curtobacterium sp. MCSS17_016]WIE81245.1 hypothetical protein DEJ19_018600 [Curtobacterium sp. MCSS17_016]
MRDNTDVYDRVADWLGGSIDADDTVSTAAGVPLLRSDIQTVLTDVTAIAEHRDQLRGELVQQARDHVRALNVVSGFDQAALLTHAKELEQNRDDMYESRQEERATVRRVTEERNELARRIANAEHGDDCATNTAADELGECDCWKAQPVGRGRRTEALFALGNLTPHRHQAWTAVQDEGHDPGIATVDLAGMVGDDIDPADAALIIRLCHPDTLTAIRAVLAAYGDANLNAAADLLSRAILQPPTPTA